MTEFNIYNHSHFDFEIPPLDLNLNHFETENDNVNNHIIQNDTKNFIELDNKIINLLPITSEYSDKQPVKQTVKKTVKNKKINKKEKSKKKVNNKILNKLNILPPNHKIARGRGRALQKAAMTKDQLEVEHYLRLERQKEAAKKFRYKKKMYVKELESKISDLEKIVKKQEEEIEKLKKIKLNLSMKLEK